MKYRPATQEARKSIDRIIQAAIDIFASKGYEGARVDAIAKEANVNKATIYYHIGDKETLYKEVLRRVLVGAADAAEENLNSDKSPEKKLKDHIWVIADKAVSINNFAPLLMREIASGGAHIPAEALKEMGRIIRALAAIISEGVKRGKFRKVNPIAIHMMIIGGLSFYSAGEKIRYRIAKLMGEKTSSIVIQPLDEITGQVDRIITSALEKTDSD